MIVSALFTKNSGQPATGLTLADIDLYLYRRTRADGTMATVWNGVNPTEEVGGGLYSRSYTDDPDTYDYYGYGQYTGATTLDVDYSLQSGSYATAVTEVDSDTANKVADHTIRRSFANAAASSDGDVKSFRSLLGAIAKLVNKIIASGATLTVYEADDMTALGTQTITTDSGADPITVLDTD
ncbi:MAG TPA: hypothetical protein VM223_12945 [Planctomycetota bacterium]|nr:hypothetical protein [Planctomycetota bacterium]